MATEPEDDHFSPVEEEDGGPIKSFLEHLEDFRWTLIKCAVTIVVGIFICLLAGNYVMGILMRPLLHAKATYPDTNQVVSVNFGTNHLGTFQLTPENQTALGLGTNQYAALEIVPMDVLSGTNNVKVLGLRQVTNSTSIEEAQRMDTKLIVLGPAKAFFVGFRMAMYAGVALASPFLFYFIGQFVLPALRVKEKNYLLKGLLFALPLFMCGVAFCYFVLMPAALAASQAYANWFGFGSTNWEAEEYIDFICKFMLGMGLGFELPVVILLLVKIGLIDYKFLSKARPYMVIINLILGAVLTTPEVLTQVLMAVPLQILFEISVLVAWYWERKERKAKAALGQD